MDDSTVSYAGKVLKGHQTGRLINFSTINLDPSVLPQDLQQGVYAALVDYDNTIYKGALYFGPRLVLHETKNVLEIHLLDFNKEIYGEMVTFQIKDFIRGTMDFESLHHMQEQIAQDVEKIKKVLTP